MAIDGQSAGLETLKTKRKGDALTTLVRQIKTDIHRRRLRYGDRYLTNTEVCQIFASSSTTADRAMRHLAKKNILTRSRGRGTFIGAGFKPAVESKKTKQIIVLQPDDVELAALLNEIISQSVNDLNEFALQINIVPSARDVEYIGDLLSKYQGNEDIHGIIAISFPERVYRLLSRSGLNVVVIGSIDNDQLFIPWVDIDYHQAGKLLVDHFLSNGHRKIAVILESENRAGTYRFCDGVFEGLAESNLAPNSVAIRFFEKEVEVFEGQLRRLFNSDDPPTALITHEELVAKTVFMLANKINQNSIDSDNIGFIGYRLSQGVTPFINAAPVQDMGTMVKNVYRILDDLGEAAGRRSSLLIPVEITAA